jgi:cellulose synthase/poly-beta-1,6-N-acetylglucosamine synthase-like glycosyltransferase
MDLASTVSTGWTTALSIGAGLLVAPVAVASVVFVGEVVASLPGAKRRRLEGARPRTAVLIPAHNEELLLGRTLDGVRAQLAEGDRVLVVADNCSDATASVARAHGAEVLERSDAVRRGKGYALDAGLKALAADPPGAVVIVDADCRLEAGAIDALARTIGATGRAAQAVYLMDPPADAGPKDRVSALAFCFKNLVRPVGLDRLGGPCLLTGSGMGMPWAATAAIDLGTGNIVEDMKLGIDLARAGFSPVVVPAARVGSVLPADERAKRTQRTRWEHGHLHSIVALAPRLAVDALRRGSVTLLLLALELAVPPLSLLVMMAVAAAVVGVGAGLLGASWLPAWVAIASLVAVGVAVLLGWWLWGRGIISAGQLFSVPFYVVGKLPMYARAIFARQTAWVRTARDGETAGRA